MAHWVVSTVQRVFVVSCCGASSRICLNGGDTGMALDMNVEINDQNQRLDSLHGRVQAENVKIEKNSREVKKMT
jgi:hypothetical protein